MNVDLHSVLIAFTRHFDDGRQPVIDVTYLNPTLDTVVHPSGPDADPDHSHEAAIAAAHALLGNYINVNTATATGPVKGTVVTEPTPVAAVVPDVVPPVVPFTPSATSETSPMASTFVHAPFDAPSTYNAQAETTAYPSSTYDAPVAQDMGTEHDTPPSTSSSGDTTTRA
jgi:hypothetical protein